MMPSLSLSKEQLLLVGSFVIWSLCLPILPNQVFDLLDNIVGVLILLLLLVYSISFGGISTVVAFIAIALTFVERNKRTIQAKLLGNNVQLTLPSLDEQLAAAPPMSPDEIHPEYDNPIDDANVVSFRPHEDAENTFESVGDSINEKQVIPTITPHNNRSEAYYVSQNLGKTELLG
jgi:hypothetical protein